MKTIADVMGGVTAPLVSVTGPAADATVAAGQPEPTGTASGTGPVSVRVYQGQYSTGTVLTHDGLGEQRLLERAAGHRAERRHLHRPGRPARGCGDRDQRAGHLHRGLDQHPGRHRRSGGRGELAADGATVDTATPTVEGTAGTAAGDDDRRAGPLGRHRHLGYAGADADRLGGTDGSWSVTPSSLDDGTYTVRAGQSDAAGNTGRSAR